MRCACLEPGGHGRLEVRLRSPHRAPHRKPGERLGRRDHLNDVGDEPEAVAHVGQRDDDARPGIRGEDEADRVLAAADGQRMDLQPRLGRRERRAYLEHVRAEDALAARRQVIGVVLHQRRAAGQAGAHDLGRPDQHRRLPVPFGAESVAVRHQPLHRQAGQLLQPAQVLEVGREGPESAGVEEGPEPELDRGTVAQRLMALLSALELGRDVIGVLVLLHQRVDVRRGGGVHRGHQVVDAPGVDLDAEDGFRLGLVAFGDGHVPHVVAEPRQPKRPRRRPPGRRPGPGRHLLDDPWITDVPRDGLTRHGQPGQHVAELPVAVRGLVQVHEVEIDRRPRQRDVGLRVQVQQRLVQGAEPCDPHLRRAERVHPRHQTDHPVVGVRLQDGPADRIVIDQDRLPDEFDPDRRGFGELCLRELGGDTARLLRHPAERLLPVQMLASGQEPDLEVVLGGRCGHQRCAPWPA